MKSKLLLACITAACFNTSISFAQDAIYNITFTSVWNSTDHGTLPGDAHWSSLVGATHKTQDAFFAVGDLSTTGIKNVAEFGSNSQFNSEVNTAITNGEADQYINAGDLQDITGDIVVSNLNVDADFSRISLISMIAPSPDWVIALNGYDLQDESDNWKDDIEIDAFAYDAGTDSGTSYEASNIVTSPFVAMSSLKNVSPFNGNRIGYFTIELQSVLSTQKINKSSDFKVAYNKNSNGIDINNINNKLIDYQLLTINGQVISERKAISGNYTIVTPKNGMYIVQITSNNENFIEKVIVD